MQGKPDVYPRNGDIVGAWAQIVYDDNQFIEVSVCVHFLNTFEFDIECHSSWKCCILRPLEREIANSIMSVLS